MVSRVLREEIGHALRSLYPDRSGISFAVSPENRFGDWTTNVALIVAGGGINARDAAEEISTELKKSKTFSETVHKTEIAGPGFINFHLSDETIEKELSELNKKISSGYDFLFGKKINIEFISANPTGELHIGHGRGAFYGDALAKILSFSGATVSREYFINDSKTSKQIEELGKTALGIGEQYKTPEIVNLVNQKPFSGLSEKEAGFSLAKEVQLQNQNFIEKKLNIEIDNWYSEEEKLHKTLLSERILTILKTKELTYEKDGAVWLKTSEYGDDEDRVLIRSDGTPTYFLSDIAYHNDKFSRGDDEIIDIWGADHHGHVKRMEAVKKMLGWKGNFRVFVTQLVSLKEGKMSKRAGNVVLLRDLVEELGLDVVRWFYDEKSLNTHMEFDMELAKDRSAKNPVFYVQYAHARICSIVAKTKDLDIDKSINEPLKENKTRALAVKLSQFPEIISEITEDYQIHHLTTYAYELAGAFSEFYENVRIINDSSYNKEALNLSEITRNTLAKSLDLLGISAPEKM